MAVKSRHIEVLPNSLFMPNANQNKNALADGGFRYDQIKTSTFWREEEWQNQRHYRISARS